MTRQSATRASAFEQLPPARWVRLALLFSGAALFAFLVWEIGPAAVVT